MGANTSELNLAAEWGTTPPSVAEYFNEQSANLQALLTNLKKHNAVRPDALGRLHDAASLQDALKDIRHLQDRASMWDFQPARDYITTALARAVQERAELEQKLRVPKGQLHEDGFYDQLKPQQQALGTELQRLKASGTDRQFPVVADAAEQRFVQVKSNLLQTERGLTEAGQRQAVQQEARLRGLLQSLPRP